MQNPDWSEQNNFELRFSTMAWSGQWPIVNVVDSHPIPDLQINLGNNRLQFRGLPTVLHIFEFDLHLLWRDFLGAGLSYNLLGCWNIDYFDRIVFNRYAYAQRIYTIMKLGEASLTLSAGAIQYTDNVYGEDGFTILNFPEFGLKWNLSPGTITASIGSSMIYTQTNGKKDCNPIGAVTFVSKFH